jgi:ribonuclease VapC
LFDHVIEAARIKAHHPLSFADCFAVATAARENAIVVTGDPEFKAVEKLVEIEWL